MDKNVNSPDEELSTKSTDIPEESVDDEITEKVSDEAEKTDETKEITETNENGEVIETLENGEEVIVKNSVFDKIKEKIVALGYENTIARLLIAWFGVACFELINSEYNFYAFEFFNDIKMTFYIMFIAIVFIILSVVNKPKLDKILLFFTTLIYGSAAVIQDNRLYFTIGMCIFMGAVTVYCTGDWIKINLKKVPTILIIVLLGLLFTLFTGLLTSFKYLLHLTPCYDFGIFTQMFNYMKETFQPLTTCERDKLLSHFAVHFSPIYYLLLPFFYLFPSPVTLLIGQGAIIASGLIPLYLICKKYKFSNGATVLFALCYVLLPSMANGCFYYLHENKFLTAIILWLLYTLEKDKWVPTIIFTILLCAVKEDAPVYAAIIGLYFIMSRRRVSKGAGIMGFAIVYFVVVSYFMSKYGLGTMNYRYNNFIYDNSDSLVTVIKAVILNPIYAVYESFDEEKIKFILQMLVPIAFMPLMSKKPSRIILFIPFFLINIMTDYIYQFDINFQYTYGSAALLIYLMVINYNDMKPEFRSKVLAVAATSSILMFMCNSYYRLDGIEQFKNDMKNGKVDVINESLELIPEDASIAATTFFVPALFEHREVYEYDSTNNKDIVEYIVLDMRFGNDKYPVSDYLNNPDYEVIVNHEGTIAIFRNTTVSVS